jgi:hypothetical protein
VLLSATPYYKRAIFLESVTFGCICITATLCTGAMMGKVLMEDEARLDADRACFSLRRSWEYNFAALKDGNGLCFVRDDDL